MLKDTEIKEKFLTLIDDFPALLFSFHPEKGVLIWNKECIHTTGISAKDVVLNPEALMIVFGDSNRIMSIIQKLEDNQTFEYRDSPLTHRFSDNHVRTIRWIFRKNRTPIEGNFYWALGQDMTLLTETLADLKSSEERFRIISNVTNDVLWDWDLKTNFVWWSPGMSSIFGHPSHAIVEHIDWWVENIHPEDRERVAKKIFEAVQRKDPQWSDGYRFRRSDNSYAEVYDKGLTIYDENGQAIRMVSGIVDMTEMTMALNKLQIKNQQLAEYSFFTSHKVRAPLSRLMGLVNIIEHQDHNPELASMLAQVREAALELDLKIREINQVIE
jgi:PAS domain S-box-containing protein